jgi:O-antigen/teichoic acid export membrane protein
LIATPFARGRPYIWGFVDQAFSSATNFGLTLLAGRVLGPGGLGVVAIAFAAYLLILAFQRALLTDPLVSSSAALASDDRSLAIRRGLTVDLFGAMGATLLLVVLGATIHGHAGRGLLIIAPWLLPALVQDFWRTILFQEQRAKAAAVNDACWGVAMVLTAPLAWLLDTDWAIAACWGSGALAGALLGFAQTRARPESPLNAFSWWRSRLWPFGRWLGVDGMVNAVASSATVFLLNGVLGAKGLGGLRAAQSLFAPLTLLLPAISLPGLPSMTRRLAASPRGAIGLAVRLSGTVSALAALYGAAMVVLGGNVIELVFGTSFSAYTNLALPIGVWQVVAGFSVGFTLLLTAQQRGRDLLLVGVTGSIGSVVFISLLAWTGGVTGAAWGYSFYAAVATALSAALALRSYRRTVRAEAGGIQLADAGVAHASSVTKLSSRKQA